MGGWGEVPVVRLPTLIYQTCGSSNFVTCNIAFLPCSTISHRAMVSRPTSRRALRCLNCGRCAALQTGVMYVDAGLPQLTLPDAA